LLAALPTEAFDRIAPSLDVVTLALKQFVHKPGERIRDIYFPGGGFISIVTVLNDGGMVEVATAGREGMVGVSAILNRDPSRCAPDGRPHRHTHRVADTNTSTLAESA
jgi:CRP-like cAMP-binding protein